jgi:hypothetical protein
MYIDYSVYPDIDMPTEELLSPEARADYVHRIVSAWDFAGTRDFRAPVATERGL